jgi:hypothetical protein
VRREIKTYEWQCDGCGNTFRMEGEGEPSTWKRQDTFCDDPYCDGHERWYCFLCVAKRGIE